MKKSVLFIDSLAIGLVDLTRSFDACEAGLYGDDVYRARSLYALIDPLLTWDDETICARSSRSRSNLSIDEELLANRTKVVVRPNPTSDILFVELPKSKSDQRILYVYDAFGSLVMEKRVSGEQNTARIDFIDEPTGIYLIQVYTPTHSTFHKVILTD